jgi:hypothetical protein
MEADRNVSAHAVRMITDQRVLLPKAHAFSEVTSAKPERIRDPYVAPADEARGIGRLRLVALVG